MLPAATRPLSRAQAQVALLGNRMLAVESLPRLHRLDHVAHTRRNPPCLVMPLAAREMQIGMIGQSAFGKSVAICPISDRSGAGLARAAGNFVGGRLAPRSGGKAP